VTAADWIQLAITAFGAIAAGAAWAAVLTSRDSARQLRIGHLIEVHAGRLTALASEQCRPDMPVLSLRDRRTTARARQSKRTRAHQPSRLSSFCRCWS
jgi:hypothetical protein